MHACMELNGAKTRVHVSSSLQRCDTPMNEPPVLVSDTETAIHFDDPA